MWTLLDKTFLEIENGETVEPFLKMNLLTKQINYKKKTKFKIYKLQRINQPNKSIVDNQI